MPFINNTYLGSPNEKPEEGWESIAAYTEAVTELKCVIDGVEVPDLFAYYADSGGSPDWSGALDLIAGSWVVNLLGLKPGLCPFVSGGYWLMLKPLPPGDHTIHISGKCDYMNKKKYQGFTIDVTYNVTVGK